MLQLLGVLVVFLGTLGIPLFQHTCLHEHITIHSVFSKSDHCAAKEELPQSSCCSKEVKSTVNFDKKCCVEDQSQIQLGFTYFQQHASHFVYVKNELPRLINRSSSLICSTSQPIIESDFEPPTFPLSRRIPLLCVWRI